MTHRATRVLVLLLAITAAGGGGYLLWTLDHRETAVRNAADAFDRTAEHSLLVVERFRAAQQSYVADGQGSEFWMRRATELLEDLDRTIAAMGTHTESAELRDGATALTTTVTDLRRMDTRAREWVRTGQPLMASDLIFTESLTTSSAIVAGVTTVRDRNRQLAAASVTDVRQNQVYVLGAAGATCLIAALLLMPPVRQTTPRDTREALRALIEGTPPTVRAESTPRQTSTATAAAPSTSAAAQTSTAPVTAPATRAPAIPASGQPDTEDGGAVSARVSSVDIPAAARLCSDLARVMDPTDLPALLERSARLLDARGLIVWVADRSGAALFPMFAHGYSAGTLSRMRGIHRDDENATALCYRSAEDRIVPGSSREPGAIVTPIVTPDGCIGVLAAEVEEGIETNADRRALSGILAAQLATLVTALPAQNDALRAQAGLG